MVSYMLKGIIPIIILAIVGYGGIKGVKIYECFVEGAKEGVSVCFRIFPYLLAMLLAVTIFRQSGALDLLVRVFKPIMSVIGVPAELVPLIFIKPLSGSGALGVFTETIRQYGADSKIGLIASILMGSTETIFYTVTVYFGAVGVKKIRHTLWAAIMADITAIIISVTLVNLYFN
ncbi:spore maturation protein [Clostridium algidicarnis]|uniref:Spore maturation protein B n=3 Tax=Clostridium algidicarnis TaxID=37659 RepID=A0A2S6FZ05_9CLOT|nr:spore maturation protein [Clostridium algidicarnis]PPK48806.1 spore maturation protein B [Clostridium algidicarnis DSM 15099]MBB6696916.1 spore maturation protein [Clostridium algidicarnis]MBU3193265.1 spore maturation protein [Clostridium algidicarnis]MBU3204621.1 spore maturation protein [Clostridium algidicarnis]MBU3206575.1 spore maturation protein [Clostridium algidicarnis]